MRERIVAGIDLGSHTIRLVVGQVSSGTDKREILQLIGAYEVPSRGISKGSIRSIDDAVGAISACLDGAERQIGVPVSETHVGIGGTPIQVLYAKGVVGVSRPDNEIREEDYFRVIDAATGGQPANFDVLHRLPQRFTVDNQAGIKDPVGMEGKRLEADVCVIQGLASHVRSLTKAVGSANVDVSGIVFTPLAAAESALSDRQRDLGVALVNIGSTTTSVAVFEEGDLLHAAVIPMGADHISRDIAIVLRTSLEVADKCKQLFVSAMPEQASESELVDLRDLGADEEELVSPRFMSDVAAARLEDLFGAVDKELRAADRSGNLPAGVVLTGGGAKLRGMVEAAKKHLRLPAGLSGIAPIPTPLTEVARDPAYASAIGIMIYGFGQEKVSTPSSGSWSSKGSAVSGKIGSSFKRIFKSFIP
ncbi:MAG: cell division protein FtsA [Candidatus Uhrbacteria bacterium]